MSDVLYLPLSPEEQTRFQTGLLELLARQTALYTSGQSSSVPLETAQELAASVLFSLKLSADSGPERCRELLGQGMEEALAQSRQVLKEKVRRCRELWTAVCAHLPETENAPMLETLNSIGTFWKRYDLRFFAHQLPCSIDYPLALPVPEERQGIDYLGLYLERLGIENEFLRRFRPPDVAAVLRAGCPEFREIPLNLFEPPAANALGRTLLGRAPEPLRLSSEEYRALAARFADKGSAEIGPELASAARALSAHLGLSAGQGTYLEKFARGLAPRAAACAGDGLRGIFWG